MSEWGAGSRASRAVRLLLKEDELFVLLWVGKRVLVELAVFFCCISLLIVILRIAGGVVVTSPVELLCFFL